MTFLTWRMFVFLCYLTLSWLSWSMKILLLKIESYYLYSKSCWRQSMINMLTFACLCCWGKMYKSLLTEITDPKYSQSNCSATVPIKVCMTGEENIQNLNWMKKWCVKISFKKVHLLYQRKPGGQGRYWIWMKVFSGGWRKGLGRREGCHFWNVIDLVSL